MRCCSRVSRVEIADVSSTVKRASSSKMSRELRYCADDDDAAREMGVELGVTVRSCAHAAEQKLCARIELGDIVDQRSWGLRRRTRSLCAVSCGLCEQGSAKNKQDLLIKYGAEASSRQCGLTATFQLLTHFSLLLPGAEMLQRPQRTMWIVSHHGNVCQIYTQHH